MLQVTFPEIARVLETLSATLSAAESHGCLCGSLCAASHYPLDRWLADSIADVDDASEGDRRALNLLFTQTINGLRGDQMEFEPLLPDDEATLEQRAAALSHWCQGFLYGFGLGRALKPGELSPHVDEILRDLADISRAAVDAGGSGEEQEEAYAELVEYLRVGVQLIHDEIAATRSAGSFAAAPDDFQLS